MEPEKRLSEIKKQQVQEMIKRAKSLG